MNKTLIGLGVLALLTAGIFLPRSEKVTQFIGAASGTTHSNHEFFLDEVTVGGPVFATSSTGVVTYTAASLEKASFVYHTAASAVTATLPASSTISWIPNPGDKRRIAWESVTSNVTLAAGTGIDLNSASTSKVVSADTTAVLEFIRKPNTDIEVLMTLGS